jgi:hypothetical protein
LEGFSTLALAEQFFLNVASKIALVTDRCRCSVGEPILSDA